jgi:glycosyltransferase involved in cell wall biosynthesis
VTLLVVGDGPERGRLEEAARELALVSSVRFEGFRTGSELVDRLNAADLMLCTSEYENWSLSLLEGLACGTPVVSTPCGGTPQMLVPISEDLIVKSDDPMSFAERINDLVSDNSHLQRMKEKSRRHAESFSWESVVARVEARLEAIVERSRQAAN